MAGEIRTPFRQSRNNAFIDAQLATLPESTAEWRLAKWLLRQLREDDDGIPEVPVLPHRTAQPEPDAAVSPGNRSQDGSIAGGAPSSEHR